MPFHDAYDAELQLTTLLHHGRWEQALAAIDAWLVTEPAHTELLLRKAQLLRQLHRYEQGLAAVRIYRMNRPAVDDLAFLEVAFLLELGQWPEAKRVLDALPATQRSTAQAAYYLGLVLLGQHDVLGGLQHLWMAYGREPGFNRALLQWASVAMQYYGKWWVRRQLQELLLQRRDDPTIGVSVGLALNVVDSRYGQHLLRRAVERYTDFVPTAIRRLRRKSVAPGDGITGTPSGGQDAYRTVNEELLAGHFLPGIDAYYRAVSADPSWTPVLAPLVAEVLVDELVRPEEARVLLEDALRREPTDYRLHLCYTKVFLKLGFGEEAFSSANCALALAPDTEKALALVQRAGAHLLLKERKLALQDLQSAVARMPDARALLSQEPSLRPLARDRQFRALLTGHDAPPTRWERFVQWLVGE
ncbi:MAG TPA: hypothetical protein VGL77_00915 [Armatimonadota bacterium]|jgi:tetratricopeptide (TPR) repeat protein